jgi:glycosyltransferase involved in cell wall biosynthesis
VQIAGYCQERSACTTLRIKQPLERMQELKLAETHIITHGHHAPEAIRKSDIIFMGRSASTPVLTMMKKAQEMGKKIVFDLDDNMFEVAVTSPHYKDCGVMNVNFENPDGAKGDVWKDGQAGFDLKRNRGLRKSFIDVVRQADWVTVTTPPLEKVYKRYNDHVTIIPNALNFRIWEKPDISHNGKEVRLLYTGAANHFEDWLFIHPVFTELQNKYKNLKIVLIGTDWKMAPSKMDYSRVEVHRWVDFEAYPYLMKSLCCDIGVAPVRVSDFNDCRSELKWVEYSALKMATVATNHGPYKRAIRNSETGLLASDEKEWVDALSTLIENNTRRRHISESAYAYVRKNYNLDYIIDQWMGVFKNLCGGSK